MTFFRPRWDRPYPIPAKTGPNCGLSNRCVLFKSFLYIVHFKTKSNIICSLFLGNDVGEGEVSATAWNTTSLGHETWLRGGGKCVLATLTASRRKGATWHPRLLSQDEGALQDHGHGPWTGSHPAGRPPPPRRTPPAVRPKPRTGSPQAGRSPPPAQPAPTGRPFPVE